MTGGLAFVWRDFGDLQLEELYALLRLRQMVFILERRSFYLDLDGQDSSARHLLVHAPRPASREPVGTLRVLPPGRRGQPVWIGRVALAQQARGQGLGAEMMRAAIGEAVRLYGPVPLALSAQCQQQKFYRRFGFVARGQPYNDGGIQHIDMHLQMGDIIKT